MSDKPASRFGVIWYDKKSSEVLHKVSGKSPLVLSYNEAEWCGAIIACHMPWVFGIVDLESIIINGDSDLVIKQINGQYSSNSNRLSNFKCTLKWCISQRQAIGVNVHFCWIPRSQNKCADKLASDRGVWC